MFINQIVFSGTTDRDAQTNTFKETQKVTNFSLCYKKTYQSKETTLWMNVSAFGEASKEAAKIRAGDNVLVTGSLSVYKTKDGDFKTSITAQTVSIIKQDIPENTEWQNPEIVGTSFDIPF